MREFDLESVSYTSTAALLKEEGINPEDLDGDVELEIY